MRTTITLALAAASLMSSAGALAQAGQDHAAHHAASAASASGSKASRAAKPKAAAAASAPAAMSMDGPRESMHEMQEMHDKMMAAGSPEERQALMADHMKAMQDGMAMMGRMKGGPEGRDMCGSQQEMMERRMDMMQMMMQMMMDRQSAGAPASR